MTRRKLFLGLFDLGSRMTEEQLAELKRLQNQVKNKELTVNEARDIWYMKYPDTKK